MHNIDFKTFAVLKERKENQKGEINKSCSSLDNKVLELQPYE